VKIACLSNASVIHTARWSAWFRGRGHDLRVYSLERGPDAVRAVALPRLPLPGILRYPLALPALARELDHFGPDLIDAHYVPNYGLLGALSGRHPLAVTAWGSDLLRVGADPVRRWRARWVLGRADLVLADADNLARAARALGARAERVRTIPWGVDLTLWTPAPAREDGLIVSTRMHEDLYDIPTVLRAAAKVMSRHPWVHLVVAGDGAGRAALEAMAKALLPDARYRFVGRLDGGELAALLGRAHIYISAARSDSTSLSLLEAMAAGALPVVSDLEANHEWLAEGDGAWFFPAGKSDEAADALERALTDPEAAARARAANRRVVESRADRDRNMARIESEFRALVGPGR